MKADEKHAHELSDAEWKEVAAKIARGERILGQRPERPELPDVRNMSDEEWAEALRNLEMRRV